MMFSLKFSHALVASTFVLLFLCFIHYFIIVDSISYKFYKNPTPTLTIISNPNFILKSSSFNLTNFSFATLNKNVFFPNITKINFLNTLQTKPKSVSNNTISVDNSVLMTREIYVSGHAKPHPELCPLLGKSLKIMILITTAPTHSEARNAIRLTWGHYGLRKDISMAFFIGTTSDTNIQRSIEREETLYGDIIRGNFLDSYRNLTLKTISILEWVNDYCPKVNKVLKMDDDVFINVPLLLKFLDKRTNDSMTIYGKVLRNKPSKRPMGSKHYVSTKQYVHKYFPDYTSGPCYLMTTDCVNKLYMQALKKPYVPIEDVYITGILAHQLGIKRIHATEFHNIKVELHPYKLQEAISIHGVFFREQFDLWEKLLDENSKYNM